MEGNPKNVADQIPVDLVVNSMLAGVAGTAFKDELRIIHCTTSASNPNTFNDNIFPLLSYWSTHKPKKAIDSAKIELIKNPLVYKWKFFWKYSAIARLSELWSKIVQTEKSQKNSHLLKRLENHMKLVHDSFVYFVSNAFTFDTTELEKLKKQLSPDEANIFNIDPRTVDFKTFYQLFCFGIQKYILKENPSEITITQVDIMQFLSNRNIINASYINKHSVIHSHKVESIMKTYTEENQSNYMNTLKITEKKVNEIVIYPKSSLIGFYTWFFRKQLKTMLNAVIVDTLEIQKVY